MSLQLILILVGAVLLIAGFVWWFFGRKKEDSDLTEDERALLEMKVFDRYEIKGLRKRAPMSTMYMAMDPETKTQVALRILKPEFSGDPDHVKGFLRRGEVLEFLNKQHGNLSVIRLLKYGTSMVGRQSRAFIATEFFDGVDLGELLVEKKILTVREATSIIGQIAKSLAVALRERVWHHQLAMEAVMVKYNDKGAPAVKLVDFDLAKQEQIASMGVSTQGVSRLTFMSPEQFENKIVDQRSDIYSLGILFYVLVSGRPPFDGSDYGEMARLHTGTAPAPLAESMAGSVRAVIVKMLAKQPGDRYRTMDDLVREIDGLVAEKSWDVQPDVSGLKPLVINTPQPKRRSSRSASSGTTSSSRSVQRESSGSSGKGSGQAASLFQVIAREIPLFYNSFVGKLIMKLLGGFTVMRLLFVLVPLLIAGLVYYFAMRSNDVAGLVVVEVKDKEGKAIAGADFSIERLSADENQSATFVDPTTDQKTKNKLSQKTDRTGKLQVKYKVSPAMSFAISVSAQGYLPEMRSDSIFIAGDTTLSRTYEFLAASGAITIASEPAGAEIIIDGKTLGLTPHTFQQLEAGRHNVKLRKTGFQGFDSTFALAQKQVSNINIPLVQLMGKPSVIVVVASDESGRPVRGAEIYVDGKSTMKFTPSTVTVPAGVHSIEVRRDGYTSAGGPTQATVAEKNKEPITVILRKIY